MHFLANENVPRASIMFLRNAGYSVVSIMEESRGMKDLEVLQRGRDEKRIILTFDKDYGELIFKLKLPPCPGVVLFRFDPREPEEPAKQLIKSCVSRE